MILLPVLGMVCMGGKSLLIRVNALPFPSAGSVLDFLLSGRELAGASRACGSRAGVRGCGLPSLAVLRPGERSAGAGWSCCRLLGAGVVHFPLVALLFLP